MVSLLKFAFGAPSPKSQKDIKVTSSFSDDFINLVMLSQIWSN